MTDTDSPVPPAPEAGRTGPPAGRIVMIVIGAVLALAGLAAAAGGGALTWAHGTQRDADGFFTTGEERLDTATAAITSEEIDLGAVPTRRFLDVGDLATVRIEVEGADEGAVFVGVGPRDDVRGFLDGVARAEIRRIDFDPFVVDYRFVDGADEAPAPGDETFWVAEGADGRPLEWSIESGEWIVVVMNADGSAGVSVDASVAAKVDWLLPLALLLLVGGLLVAAGGVLLVVFGIRGLSGHPGPESAEAPAGEPATASGPAARGLPAVVRLRGTLDEPLSRWLWLVKWFLLIPHLFVLFFLWVAVAVVTVIAWFAILFTGRYPRSLFTFTVGVLRWSWRVSFYSYGALGTDRYPPFSLEDEPDYPAALDVEYPERLSRGLVLVKSWFLALPHLFVLAVVAGWGSGRGLLGWDGSGRAGPALLDLLVLIAGGFLLFVARYPRGLFDFVMGLDRWILRVLAYVLLLRDEYPPFRLDQGEDEPPPPDQAADTRLPLHQGEDGPPVG